MPTLSVSRSAEPYADTARDYIAKGWVAPLPLPAGEKGEPPSGFTGWRKSRWVTPSDVATWIEEARGTGANIGNRVPPGVVGVDYDAYRDPDKVRPGHSFADRVAAWGELPPTWASTSRTDGSMIRWFRVQEGLKLPGDAGDDVEIIHSLYRYAVAPPSRHPEGRDYFWMTPDGEVTDEIPDVSELPELPAAWAEGLSGLGRAHVTEEAVDAFLGELPDDDQDDDIRRIVNEFTAFLDEGKPGRHEEMLRVTWELAVAGANGARGVPSALAEAEDAFVSARSSAGGSDREAAGEWARGLSGAVGHLGEYARPLEPWDVDPALRVAIEAVFAEARGKKTKARHREERRRPPLREQLLRRGDLARLPRPEPLIEETLDLRTVALLAGYHGTYKSFVALSWAASVATGTPWLGRKARRGRVLYVVGEGATGIDGRLSAWEEANGVRIGDEDLYTLPIAVQIAEPNALDEVLDLIEDIGFDLVVIDTVARSAVGLEENSSKDMGIFVDAADQIRRVMPAGTVLLVHHTGKDKTKVRGSSAVEAAMDTVYLTEGGDGLVDLKRTKRKDGPRDDHQRLRFRPVGISGVLDSLNAPADPIESMDRLAVSFSRLHRTFGHVGRFAGTHGAETLMTSLGIGRSAARDRLADLTRDGILTVESVGRGFVYTLDADAAIKRWGTGILDLRDREEGHRTPGTGEDDGLVTDDDGSLVNPATGEILGASETSLEL